MARKLTRSAFKKWLESKVPTAVAGYTCSDKDCPLARASGRKVYTGGEVTRGNWGREFVYKVDAPYSLWGEEVRITAKRALTILESIP